MVLWKIRFSWIYSKIKIMTSEEIKKDISVSSRIKNITDEEKLKIIDFIINHSFKDSEEVYTNGTILVPLFRVLDALSQKGELYNESV